MSKNNNVQYCSNCGYPVNDVICPYCKKFTGMSHDGVWLEYPVIECKEGSVTFANSFFLIVFSIPFILFGFSILFANAVDLPSKILAIFLFVMFGGAGLLTFSKGLKPIINFFIVKLKGKKIEATVYGVVNDHNLHINEKPAQIVQLLINTEDGYKLIFYELGTTNCPYEINNKVVLQVYKDKFLIVKNLSL